MVPIIWFIPGAMNWLIWAKKEVMGPMKLIPWAMAVAKKLLRSPIRFTLNVHWGAIRYVILLRVSWIS